MEKKRTRNNNRIKTVLPYTGRSYKSRTDDVRRLLNTLDKAGVPGANTEFDLVSCVPGWRFSQVREHKRCGGYALFSLWRCAHDIDPMSIPPHWEAITCEEVVRVLREHWIDDAYEFLGEHRPHKYRIGKG